MTIAVNEKPRITERNGRKGVQCRCGDWQQLDGYVFAHAHVKLYRMCKCGRELMLHNMQISEVRK